MKIPEVCKKDLSESEFKEYWQKLVNQQISLEGYIYMSNSPLQNVLLSPKPLPSWEELHNNFNFIWEANLYEKKARSISIYQLEDKWLVCEVKWGCDPLELLKTQETQENFSLWKYILHKHEEYKALMLEAWLPKKDEFCCDMEVLQPTWTAFIGFEYKG